MMDKEEEGRRMRRDKKGRERGCQMMRLGTLGSFSLALIQALCSRCRQASMCRQALRVRNADKEAGTGSSLVVIAH